MSKAYLPLHKEFGIFLVGWTGAITITVAMYYAVHPAKLFAIASDWLTGMAMGIGALAVFWVVYKILVEVVAPIIESIRHLIRRVF